VQEPEPEWEPTPEPEGWDDEPDNSEKDEEWTSWTPNEPNPEWIAEEERQANAPNWWNVIEEQVDADNITDYPEDTTWHKIEEPELNHTTTEDNPPEL